MQLFFFFFEDDHAVKINQNQDGSMHLLIASFANTSGITHMYGQDSIMLLPQGNCGKKETANYCKIIIDSKN